MLTNTTRNSLNKEREKNNTKLRRKSRGRQQKVRRIHSSKLTGAMNHSAVRRDSKTLATILCCDHFFCRFFFLLLILLLARCLHMRNDQRKNYNFFLVWVSFGLISLLFAQNAFLSHSVVHINTHTHQLSLNFRWTLLSGVYELHEFHLVKQRNTKKIIYINIQVTHTNNVN